VQAPKEWHFYPHGYSPEPHQQVAATANSSSEAPAPDSAGTSAGSSTSKQQHGPEFHQVGDEKVPGPDESGRAGPLSKEALRQLHSRGVITHDTWMWAPGMAGPVRLSGVRELRWMCCSGLGLLGPFEAALVSLQVSDTSTFMLLDVLVETWYVTMAPLVQGSAQHGVTLGAALDVLQWAGASGAVWAALVALQVSTCSTYFMFRDG
jgi:hypothetical protein